MFEKIAQKNWWKIIGVSLVAYTIVAGFLLPVPRLPILNETIRNLYYHVPAWFAMIFLMTVSLYASIRYLLDSHSQWDLLAYEASRTGIIFSVFGLITGMVWANYTWGTPWTNDPKLNGVAVALLFYAAYFLLRQGVSDEQKKARLSAVYNIFAYAMLILFVMILPRQTSSLHPGNGGNPGFNKYDLDSNMRLVFYPAVFGWILIATWIMSIRIRLQNVIDANEK